MARAPRLTLTCAALILSAVAFAAAPARKPPASSDNGSAAGNANKSTSADHKKSAAATFEVYQDRAGEYRWRLRARNSQVIAMSPDGYKEKRSCLSAIDSVRKDVADAPVEEQAANSTDAKDGKEAKPDGRK